MNTLKFDFGQQAIKRLLTALLFLASSFGQAAPLTLPNAPLSSASGVDIKPNIMFVLDDSDSMSLDYLPDWAGGIINNDSSAPRFSSQPWHLRNSRFNGLAYNPALRYLPPVYYTSSGARENPALSTSTYPTQNAANTASWSSVKRNPYDSSSVSGPIGSAYFYTTQAGEYCTNATLKSCSGTASATYSVPAFLRWCNSDVISKAASVSAGNCQSTQINNQGALDRFGYPRFPSPRTSTINFVDGSVSSIQVGGKEIMKSAVTGSMSAADLASAVETEINKCLFAIVGSCTTYGYRATVNGSTMSLYSPSDENSTPSITASPSLTATAFARPADNLAPGENLITVITPSRTSYPKASGRNDCAGADCSYDEEMTNYANWYAYYRTRLQAMKTSASHAFADIDATKKVGLMSINNNTGASGMGVTYQDVSAFGFPHKFNWYSTLFAAVPQGVETPLRQALATAGQIFAGKKIGTFNGKAMTDPVEYYCQPNVTILSTDGYWNGAAGTTLGTTATNVGDRDGPDIIPIVSRPQLDGGAPAFLKTTTQIKETRTPTVDTQQQQKEVRIESQQQQLEKQTLNVWQKRDSSLESITHMLEKRVARTFSSTSNLQTRTRQLQQSNWQTTGGNTYSQTLQKQRRQLQIQQKRIQQKTKPLQTRVKKLMQQTSTLQVNEGTLKESISSLQVKTGTLQSRAQQVQTRTSSDGGATWTIWSDSATCTPASGTRECKFKLGSGVWSNWSAAGSCTITTLPNGVSANPYVINQGMDTQQTIYKTITECQYNWTGPVNATESCTNQTPSSGSPYTVSTARECTYTAWSSPSSPTSGTCTPTPQSSGTGAWGVLTASQCSYTWTGPVNATTSCTAVTESSGTGTWNIATARTCAYTAFSTPATETPSCTIKAQSTGTTKTELVARNCAYESAWPTSWTTVSSGGCTVKTEDTGDTKAGPASQCQYGTETGWTNLTSPTSCTISAPTAVSNYTANPQVTNCQLNTSNIWNNVASCTADAATSVECRNNLTSDWQANNCTIGTSTSATGLISECENRYTQPVLVTTCTPSATVQCVGEGWGNWYDVTSCANNGTQAAGGSRCQYLNFPANLPTVGAQGWDDVAEGGSCRVNTPSSGGTPSATVTWDGPVRECRYTAWSTPVEGSCTAVARGAGNNNDNTVWPVSRATSCGNSATISNTSNANPTWSTTILFGAWGAVPSGENCATSSTFPRVECQYVDGTQTTDATCSPVSKSASSPYSVRSAKTCVYSGWGTWDDIASCSAVPQSNLTNSGPYEATARECQPVWSQWDPATNCTDDDNNNCRYTNATWVATPGGCTPLPASTGPSYTVGTATLACNPILVNDWANVSGCSAGPSGSNVVSCQTVRKPPVGPTAVASCGELADDGSAEHNTVTCSTTTTGPDLVASCSNAAASYPNFIRTDCVATTFGATANTLADVAQYYYMTDLRTTDLGNCTGRLGTDVCENEPAVGSAPEKPQRMITYTLGLGASGVMRYDPDYTNPSLTDGDYYSIRAGQAADPGNGVCSWQNSGTCNWPTPVNNEQTNIDDLWHAAVNGRGIYYSATDPNSLSAGIKSALNNISQLEGALAAVALTNPNFVAGDNGIFEVSFKVGDWTGDLTKRSITITNTVVNGETIESLELSSLPTWSAQTKLSQLIASSGHSGRTIYTFDPDPAATDTNKLKGFTWAELSTAEQGLFTSPHAQAGNTVTGGVQQFCSGSDFCLSSGARSAAEGEALVNFIRGDRSNEDTSADANKFFRRRTGVLGDIIGSEAVFVGKSPWTYADHGHVSFSSSTASRTPLIYVGANDGMLHAFNASTGVEAWAYVPKLVMTTLHKLASKNYGSTGPVERRYSVDGTPVYGDICTADCTPPTPPATNSPVWKTILVGGLNAGGRGYYALDITDPANPKALWEFVDDNLGYSYGNPVITKLKDGTWVVMFASGYNNTSPGDGRGRLFVVNASTGSLIRSIPTSVGTTTTPAGLAKISAWANFPDVNNMAQRVYGGDLEGNLWRFDVNGDIPAVSDPIVYVAQRLATLKDSLANIQPITTRPELGSVKGKPVIYVGTGKLLEFSDLSSGGSQSIYAIRDRLTESDYGNPRSAGNGFVAQTISNTTCPAGNSYCTEGETIRTMTANAVDFTTDNGWFADFPGDGERVNTDPRLVLGTLDVRTNRPLTGVCKPAGESYAYYFDYRSGSPVEEAGVFGGLKLGDFISASSTPFRLPSGLIRELIRTDQPGTLLRNTPASNAAGGTRRISWRELIREQ